MTTINGVINKVAPRTVISVNGGAVVIQNGIRQLNYDKWGMVWNGNHFAPPSASSVLYLPGLPGQGSTILDYSGQGNDGSITGASWRQLPSGLWYPDFDGVDNKVVVTSASSLNFSEAESFGIKAWINTPDGSGQRVVNKIDTAWYYLFIGISANKISFRISDAVNSPLVESTTSIADGIWHQVWGVRDVGADELRIYIDGASDQTPTTDTTTGSFTLGGTADLGIGAKASDAANPYEGGIALTEIVRGLPSAAFIASSYAEERHLFGV